MRALWMVGFIALGACNLVLGIEETTLGDPGGGQPDATVIPKIDAALPVDAPPLVTVTLTISRSGDGFGRVAISPGTKVCPPDCSVALPMGQHVALTARPSTGSSLGAFGAEGCGASAMCELDLTADRAVDVTFSDNSGGANFIFVSKTKVNLKGLTLAKADEACAADATTYGIPGNYVSWLSTSQLNARDRLIGSRGWVRPDGKPFTDTPQDLRNGKIFYPPRLDAEGAAVPIASFVVTATGTDGALGQWTCADFTDEMLAATWGQPSHGTYRWTDSGAVQCSTTLPVYCFGVGRNKEVAAPTASGRGVFLIESGFDASTGIAAADLLCLREADAAGLDGFYKALLTPLGASAISRFTRTDEPWVRPDGVIVSNPTVTPFEFGDIEVPIGVTARRTYPGSVNLWAGAKSILEAGTVDTTCNDWSSSNNMAGLGQSYGIKEWFYAYTGQCNAGTTFGFLCLEDAAPPSYTLTVTPTGTGTGTVNVGPLGKMCPPDCEIQVYEGQHIELSAVPNGGAAFEGFTTDGCNATGTCEFDMTGHRVVSAAFTDVSGGANFVFLSKTYAPQVGVTLAKADALCASDAAAAKLPGTYVAWLSTSSVAAKTRIAGSRGWVRTDGKPVFDTVADLLAGKIMYPILLDATGARQEIWLPFTATNADGTYASDNCSGFTSESTYVMTGDMHGGTQQWTASGLSDCVNPKPIYCFGVGRNKAVARPARVGRVVFSTDGQPDLASGAAGADTLCRNEAMSAGLPGQYKALIATNGASMASRFTPSDVPWVRPDGVVVTRPNEIPFNGNYALDANINVTPMLKYRILDVAVTGATTMTEVGTPATTCNNWTNKTNSFQTIVGSVGYVGSWIYYTSWFCDGTVTMYCLQNP